MAVRVFRRGEPVRKSHVYAERIAEKFNLRITSGYRSPAENAAVGGALNSYHVQGLAQDYVPKRSGFWGRLDKAKLWALTKFRRRKFVEVLWRAPGHHDHIHLAFRPGKAKRSDRRY